MATDHRELFESLDKLEGRISPVCYPESGQPWFETVAGDGEVLLSAPHACRHMRDGTEKPGEEYTAALAQYIAQVTGNCAVFTTHKSDEDPNWLETGEYKKVLTQLVRDCGIKLVVDLHGMTNRHHMGIALGTINGRASVGVNVIAPFVQHGFVQVAADTVPSPLKLPVGVQQTSGTGAEQHRLRLVVDHPRFTGGVRNHTVTRFVSEQLGVAAVQVEIASVNRIVHRASSVDWPFEYRGNPDGIAATVDALSELAGVI